MVFEDHVPDVATTLVKTAGAFKLPLDLLEQSGMQTVLPNGPPSHDRTIDGPADPRYEVTKPDRRRFKSFSLPTTQPVKLYWVIVIIAPEQKVVVIYTLSAIILRDFIQIIVKSVCSSGVEDFRIIAVAAALLG